MAVQSTKPMRTRGFTLVELMISIFLMLIVMVGVNQIFSVVTSLIATGGAVTAMNQNARNALPIIADDFRSEAGVPQPWIVIQSQQQTAFMDINDQVSDEYFVSGNTTGPGPNWSTTPATWTQGVTEQSVLYTDVGGQKTQLSRALYGQRSHRVDSIFFFGSGKFRSLDSHEVGMGSFGTPMSSAEAYIYYGMCKIGPAYANFNYANPGTPEFYARNWVLGRRVQMLFKNIPTDPTTNLPYTGYNTPSASDWNNLPVVMVPAGTDYLSGTDTTPDSSNLYDSHFDMEKTSIDLQYQLADTSTFSQLADWPGGFSNYSALTQFTKPITPSQINLSAPAFLKNCSSFAVEFAGDYLAQFPDGLIKPTVGATAYGPAPQTVFNFYNWAGTDGLTDFYIDPATGAKKIRWYGLPRDANGTGRILSQDPTHPIALTNIGTGPTYYQVNGVTTSDLLPTLPPPNSTTIPVFAPNNIVYSGSLSNLTNPNYITNVVPINSVINSTNDIGSFILIQEGGNTHAGSIQYGNIAFPYEAWVTPTPTLSTNNTYDYADPIAGMGECYQNDSNGYWSSNGKYRLGFPAGSKYPTMIRFIITLEDPSGKSAGHTYEYVMNVH